MPTMQFCVKGNFQFSEQQIIGNLIKYPAFQTGVC